MLNLKKYSKLQLVDNIEELKCSYELISSFTNRTNRINKPYLLNNTQKNLIELNGSVPDIDIYLLKDIKIQAKSTSLIKNNMIYSHYLKKMEIFHDFKNPINQKLSSFKTKLVDLYFKKNEVIKDEYCIHLLSEHSSNYYHFMFEILPKFIIISDLVNKNKKLSSITFIVLLDENCPHQFVEILKYFSTINYKIKFISRHNIFTCNKLLFCTDLWTSLDNTKFLSDIINDFFVDKYALGLIKNKCKLEKVEPFRKVYFQRKNTQARYLSNTKELENLLSELDFEFILPEKLSFQEQIDLMNECKVMIGVSGAVFSNILFMQKNTNAIIFSPDTIATNYYVFQSMADVANVKLTHVLTKNNFHDNIHTNSSIDINEVSSFLNKLEKE
ncbi:glycosyltransferase family 61 protein [Aliarcobacter butzleri]